MAKGYWVNTYRKIIDPAKLDAYRKLAGPAVEAAGGRFVVRGDPTAAHEAGLMQRTVIVEFATIDDAIAAHESPAYQEALRVLDGGVERDLRIVEGLE